MQEINYKKLRKVILFFLDILPKIDYKYNDLLILLRVKSLNYPDKILSKMNQYTSCTNEQKEELKQNETIENIELYERVIKETESYNLIPSKLYEYILVNQLESQVFSILGITDKTIDTDKLIELLLNNITDTANYLDNSHKIKQQLEKVDKVYLFIEYYQNRKKDEIDLVVDNQIEFNNWNIYDLSWLENNIITGLRKDSYSIEWLDNTDIETVFLAYLNLCDRRLIESADYWFRDKLREIETKVNEKIETGDKDNPSRERSHSEKEAFKLELDAQYFI